VAVTSEARDCVSTMGDADCLVSVPIAQSGQSIGLLSLCSQAGLEIFGIEAAKAFCARVDCSDTDGCWPWTGPTRRSGYGSCCVRSRDGQVESQAHRVAWALAFGPIPAGKAIRHVVCGNAPCCRPTHLTPGTQKENCEDTVRMGRSTFGSKNTNAKFTDLEILAIRADRAAGAKTVDIARARKVSNSLISMICRGKLWRHLLPPDFREPTPCRSRGWHLSRRVA